MEVEFWKELGPHKNIVSYIDSEIVKQQDGAKEMLILSELCTNGTLVTYVEGKNNVLEE